MASAQPWCFVFTKRSQLILTFLLWVFVLSRVDGQDRSDEVKALLNFKSKMIYLPALTSEVREFGGVYYHSGGYWSSWKETDGNACGWIGVTCTANSTVEQLDLSGWGLIGISDWTLNVLSQLRDLQQLDLSSNSLGLLVELGAIPDAIGNLTGLIRLDLSRNYFKGQIPSNLSLCRSLRYISLEHNRLDGEIPSLRGLTKLQVLLLAGNNLSGQFPRELGEISSLVTIDVSGNMLSGVIPSFPNLTNLRDLNLDNNNFMAFEEPLLPIAKNLEHLSVSGNQMEGMIPPGITNLLNLACLNMSRNRLSGNIPLGFSRQLNNGFWIDLSQNQLTGEIPVDMLQPNYYSELRLYGAVNLSHNRLTGDIPFNKSGERFYFTFLDFSDNQLSGPIPAIFDIKTTMIGTLWLHHNLLSGDVVDVLAGGLADSSALSGIVDLQLGNNLLTGDLSRMVTDHIWDALKNLKTVDLSNNNLWMSTAKTEPDPLGATLSTLCTSVTEFRVGGNDFSGIYLPTSCDGCSSMYQILDLSNANLKGEIPRAFFNNTCTPILQSLNLSNNDLTGSVPKEIFMNADLVVLDLSYNRLSGFLPLIPPNSSLYNSNFFTGNSELCGDPLPSCNCEHVPLQRGVPWSVLLIIFFLGGATIVVMGSFFFATWRWRVYRRQHQQDADLIRTLLERESASLMPLRELRKATENFAENMQIGEGGFGTVYTGKLSDGTIVAIKRSKREGSEKDKDQFLNEVRILSQVNHRYLVKLLGCCMENKLALLVFEFVSNGTLQQHLQGRMGSARLSWKQRLNIAVQTADALSYLHSAATFPIYHRDVKSANILLNEDLNAKVADFGISKLAPVEATHVSTVAVQGTMGYIDPEYYTSFQLTDKSDVYSFGVVLLELISAKPAIDFLRGGEETSLVNFANPHIGRGDLQQLIDPALMETYMEPAGSGRESMLSVGRLAMKCVDMRSKARPSMKEVWKELQNPWLELNDASMQSLAIHEDDNEDPRSDHIVLFSQSFSGDSSSFVFESNAGGIQMSQFSRHKSFR